MNKLYNTDKLFCVKLARVTEFIPSTFNKQGAVYSTTENHIYIAKLIKIEKCYLKRDARLYKLINSGLKVFDNHNKINCVGDLYIDEIAPFNYVFDNKNKFLPRSYLLKLEEEINKEENLEQQTSNTEEKTKDK